MIKLLGWEKPAEKDIAEKRDAELTLLWRARMLGVLNFFVK